MEHAIVDYREELSLLGGARNFGNPKSYMELHSFVLSNKVNISSFHAFAKIAQLSSNLKFQIVPKSTAARAKTISSGPTDKLLRLAHLTVVAKSIFDDNIDVAVEFLNKPHPELGNHSPYEFAMTDIGSRQVESLLRKIEYGLPA